ncbi:carboxypeptidase-like regulatory domain-containing protein [Pedobacter sp. Hv1]|uniref:carboxypeptidase-like regulatory domain-containing protein n=1 Tax=Pedobacter sp. Hv1 TaxID=1740090 RepID=UPI0006D89E3A|nr:carboxypeptidase-like regulatory domain-containing protein [Pedobacter sp. Hv1]KQC00155.1 hypothetical protein AQF98_11660 [Pedobacter sp. Hv1]
MCISFASFAQSTLTINGTVRDEKGLLPGATIYVSGYQMATSTDHLGKFILPKLVPGSYDILVQMIGYKAYKKRIVISDKSVTIDVTLQEDPTSLNEIVVKLDPKRAAYVKLFLEVFIGKTPNASQCKLLNPNALIFNYDKENDILSGSANELLTIENKALGYTIKYMLEGFEFNKKAKVFYFDGQAYFQEMEGSKAGQRRWLRAREIAYHGSREHFFRSLYNNTITQEGYIINKMYKTPHPKDSLINANIKRLTEQSRKVTQMYSPGVDSIAYWIKQRNIFQPENNFDTAKVNVDTLVKVYDKDMKMMSFKDALFIIYTRERETDHYFSSGNWQARPEDMPNYQVSIINRLEPQILFYANGTIPEPKSILYQGFFAYEKIADMLPIDYVPQQKPKP